MAVGIYQVTSIGECRQWTDKKTGEIKVSTPCAIDGQPVDIPGNGIKPFTRLFVYGDLRRYENRQFFDNRVQNPVIIPAEEDQTLADVVELLRGVATK